MLVSLAAGSSERTLLLEAGPDYGPADSGRWPHDLLDATSAAQWCLEVDYEGSDGLIERMERHQVETGWRPDEQVTPPR